MNYEIILGIIVFLFGTVFGSFYNVVIYRLPAEMSISKGRSMCFTCKHPLGPLDLVPLLSYIFLGGKCRYCKTKFSPRYFFVELLTGLLFLLAYYKYSISIELILMCIFFSMLVIVGFIDWDTFYIYDDVLKIFAVLLGIVLVIDKKTDVMPNILGALIGAAIYAAIYFLSKIIFKQEAFGQGDIYLNAVIGLVIGSPYIAITSIFSFFVGLFFIIIFKLLGRKFEMRQEIPFGPYMCISAVIISTFGSDMVRFYVDNFLYL